eukprot:CAMPEP_0117586184 /NCGR_PEP_ID=MMETSP0784-20121206/68573_1 /TAXON_ID=39447 /ORGANISM="" /LENGTH=356 /DNA_ID=CAMNT_0005387241 /DNA_START=39 /DNA_END=1109 /DNA_ORIENTATION=-
MSQHLQDHHLEENLFDGSRPASELNASCSGGYIVPFQRQVDSHSFVRQVSPDRKERVRGAFKVFLSTIGFSLASVIVKLDLQPSGLSFPTLEIAFARAIVGLLLSVSGLTTLGLPCLPSESKKVLLTSLLRGGLDFIASNLFYFSCSKLPIALATVIFFTNPLWAGVLAKIVLGEPYGPRRIAITILGCLGILVAVWPELFHTTHAMSAHGLVCAVLGSVFQASQYVAGRVCCRGKMHWLQQNMAYSVAGIVLGPLALSAFKAFGYDEERFVGVQAMTRNEVFATTGVVFCALFSQVCLITGMSHIPATTTAVIRTLDIPMAMVWAGILLGVVPGAHQILGAALLVTACILLSRTK